MRKLLLRTAMALGVAALALSFTGLVQAQGPSTNAPAPPPKPQRHQFTGEVASIDAKAGTVIVKKGAESKTFKISDKTRYNTVDKTKGATLADIKVGDKVLVRYTEEDGVLTAHSIGVPPVAKSPPSTQ